MTFQWTCFYNCKLANFLVLWISEIDFSYVFVCVNLAFYFSYWLFAIHLNVFLFMSKFFKNLKMFCSLFLIYNDVKKFFLFNNWPVYWLKMIEIMIEVFFFCLSSFIFMVSPSKCLVFESEIICKTCSQLVLSSFINTDFSFDLCFPFCVYRSTKEEQLFK